MQDSRSSRSPFQYLDSFCQQSSVDGKALRTALYNTAVLLFASLVIIAIIAVYFILQAFLTPLLWAVLLGTCLHPVKRQLTNIMRNWLNGLKDSNTPIILGTIVLPFSVTDNIIEKISVKFIKHAKFVICFTIGLPSIYMLYHFGPVIKLLIFLQKMFFALSHTLGLFSTYWVGTGILAYLLVVIFYWTPSSKEWLKLLSIPVWIGIVVHLAALTGPLKVPLFLLLVVIMLVGAITEINNHSSSSNFFQSWNLFGKRRAESKESLDGDAANLENIPEESELEQIRKPKVNTEVKPPKRPVRQSSKSESIIKTKKIFYSLFWAKVIVYAWTNVWVIQLLPLIVALFLLKKLGLGIGSSELWKHYVKLGCVKMESWLDERLDALAPAPVRGIYTLILRGDQKIKQALSDSLDNLISVAVILLLIFGTFFITLFLAIQIQNESIELVGMSSRIINQTMHSAYAQFLPEKENMQKTVDSMVGNAYVFGRVWISKKIDLWLDTNAYNKAKIEEQVLELWDRLYARLSLSNNTSNASISDAANIPPKLIRQSSFSQLPTSLSSMWETLTSLEMFSTTKILDFVKENLGTMTSVLESVWGILRGNLSLCIYVLSTVISLLFGGGTAVLNFVVSSLVFLTTLYLLLCFSNEYYLPVSFIMNLSPSSKSADGRDPNKQKDTVAYFYQAANDAISGVFLASIKMALFYGLYTSLIHTVFGVNLVFIPSAVAALLGAVPFLGTYWAAVPAILELVIVRQEYVLGVLLLVAQMLPTYIVDTAIYSEISGAGHPYLIGLAVAGGIYCLGLEGAVIGPILLTGLLVIVNMYRTVIAPSALKDEHHHHETDEDVVRARQSHRVHYATPLHSQDDIDLRSG